MGWYKVGTLQKEIPILIFASSFDIFKSDSTRQATF